MIETKLHTTCYTLPLNAFIDALVDSDYTGLVLSGKPTDAEIADAWEKIYDQYSQISGNSLFTSYMLKLQEYGRALVKMNILISSIEVLSLMYNADVVQALNDVGFKCTFDQNDIEAYMADLDKLSKYAANVSVKLKHTSGQLEEAKKQMSNKAATRADFVNSIAIVSKYMGFKIDPTCTAVAEFVTYQKMLEQEQRHTLNTKDNGRRKN